VNGVFTRKWRFEDTDKQGEFYGTMRAETAIRQLQAKKHQRLPANHQEVGKGK
jgi:hypothetical protein